MPQDFIASFPEIRIIFNLLMLIDSNIPLCTSVEYHPSIYAVFSIQLKYGRFQNSACELSELTLILVTIARFQLGTTVAFLGERVHCVSSTVSEAFEYANQ